MSIEITWDNQDKTVLRVAFNSPWTWEEAYRVAEEARHMIDSVDHTVDAVMDLSGSVRIPGNTLSNARTLSRKRHPRAGITVACGANPALTALWNIFSQLYGVMGIEPRYQFAENVEQAREKLKQAQLKRNGVRV